MVPGATLVGVDARRFSVATLNAAIERSAKTPAPIDLLVDNRQTFETLHVTYGGGVRLPSLSHAHPEAHDFITDIVRSRTTAHAR